MTASAMKPSVPSEPISRRRKISTGSSASRKAQSRYPVVFLIRNFFRIRSLSSASARISSRISARPFARLGLGLLEALGRPRRGRVDHGPGGQHEGQRSDGAVGVRDDAAAHAARVVRQHPADAGDVGAGGIGTELAPVWRQDPVGVAQDGAGLHPHAGALVEHLHPAPVPPDVDQDSVALRLPVQAGSSGAEGDRHALHAARGEDLRDVVRVARHHDRLREQPVGARVGGVADQVDDPGEDPIRSQQLDQLAAQRLRRPRGELVRRPVLGGSLPSGAIRCTSGASRSMAAA